MVFKHELGDLSIDPGLPWDWVFEKSVQTHIWMDGHSIVTIPGHCMVKNQSRVAWMCSQYIIARCPYTLRSLM